MNRRRAAAVLRGMGRTDQQAAALLDAARREGRAFTGDVAIGYRRRVGRYRMKAVR